MCDLELGRNATLELVGYLLRWSYARFLSYYKKFPRLLAKPCPPSLRKFSFALSSVSLPRSYHEALSHSGW